MPNFVKVDSKPFHPETYVGPEQEDEELTAESLREKSMSIKLKVENTVRWKWVKDEHGQDVSNLPILSSLSTEERDWGNTTVGFFNYIRLIELYFAHHLLSLLLFPSRPSSCWILCLLLLLPLLL